MTDFDRRSLLTAMAAASAFGLMPTAVTPAAPSRPPEPAR